MDPRRWALEADVPAGRPSLPCYGRCKGEQGGKRTLRDDVRLGRPVFGDDLGTPGNGAGARDARAVRWRECLVRWHARAVEEEKPGNKDGLPRIG